MKQRIFWMVVILIMGGSGLVFSRDDQDRLTAFEGPRRPGAVFSHDEHNEKAGLSDNCALCHHVYENKQLVEGESSEDKACSDCHGLKSGPENGIPLVRAFHSRCRDCHFDSGKGPVLCGQCHKKE